MLFMMLDQVCTWPLSCLDREPRFCCVKRAQGQRGSDICKDRLCNSDWNQCGPFLQNLPCSFEFASKEENNLKTFLCCVKLKFLNDEGVLEDRAKKILNLCN